MARTDLSVASNARVVSTVEYGVEQRGWRTWFALASRQQQTLAGRDSLRVGPNNAEFNGYAASPQKMVGLAPLALAGRVVTPNTSQLVDDRSTALDDPALRIFAARLRRGQR